MLESIGSRRATSLTGFSRVTQNAKRPLRSAVRRVAAMLRELGAHVSEADELGREMMEPGHEVYAEIVRHFGTDVVNTDGHLNRARLAELAFRKGRLQELNAIVHP